MGMSNIEYKRKQRYNKIIEQQQQLHCMQVGYCQYLRAEKYFFNRKELQIILLKVKEWVLKKTLAYILYILLR